MFLGCLECVSKVFSAGHNERVWRVNRKFQNLVQVGTAKDRIFLDNTFLDPEKISYNLT